jgi:AraC-like DNA-binding protein
MKRAHLNIQFSIFDLLILLGIAQGIITSALLLTTKKNRLSNRFLALGILSFCLLTTKPLLHTLSLWHTNPFRYFPNALELAVAPLIFFYVKSLLTPGFQMKARDWLHFVPFFLSQAFSFFVYFSVVGISNFSEKDRIARSLLFDEIKQLDEYVLLGFTLFYLYQGYKLLRGYKQWFNNSTSDTSLPDFKWLRNLFILFCVTAAILLFGRVVRLSSDLNLFYLDDFYWKFISLYMAFLIYYLGLRGYLQPNYSFPKREQVGSDTTEAEKQMEQVSEQIEKAMKEDKLFLDSKLSIQSLSKQTGLPQREISQAINQYYQTNFRDFINSRRLEHVKLKLNSTDYSHMSILGIALESGFNSEASFYRLFKKHNGLTPKEYMRQKSAD